MPLDMKVPAGFSNTDVKRRGGQHEAAAACFQIKTDKVEFKAGGK